MDGYEVITDYTEANKYTFPSDGYLEIQANNSEASVLATLQGANEKTGVILHENNSYETIFVRKGMKYYTISKSGNASVLFVPLS